MSLISLIFFMWLFLRLGAPWWLYVLWTLAMIGWVFGKGDDK